MPVRDIIIVNSSDDESDTEEREFEWEPTKNRSREVDGRVDQFDMPVGGPVHSFPPFIYFLARPFFLFFCSGGNRWNCEHPKNYQKTPKNRQTPNKERPFFRQDDWVPSRPKKPN